MDNEKNAICFNDFYKLVELNENNYCMTYEITNEISNRKKITYNKDDYLFNLNNAFKDKENFLYKSIEKILNYEEFGIIGIEDFFTNLNTTFKKILDMIIEIINNYNTNLNDIYIHYDEINKSNFWLSLLLCKFLNDKKINKNIKDCIFFIDDSLLIKNRDKNRKKYIFLIDDCSYSGSQLKTIIESYYKLYNFSYDPLLRMKKNNIQDDVYNVEKINVFTMYISNYAYDYLTNIFEEKFYLFKENNILTNISYEKNLLNLLIDNSYVFVEKIDNKEIVLIDVLNYLGFTTTKAIYKLLEIKSADSISSLQYFYNFIKPPILNIQNIDNVKIYKLKEIIRKNIINGDTTSFYKCEKGKEIKKGFHDIIDIKNININIQTINQFGLLNSCYNSDYYKYLNKEIKFDYENENLCYSAFYRKENFNFDNECIIKLLKENCVQQNNIDFINKYEIKYIDKINNCKKTGGNLNIYNKFKYIKYY